MGGNYRSGPSESELMERTFNKMLSRAMKEMSKHMQDELVRREDLRNQRVDTLMQRLASLEATGIPRDKFEQLEMLLGRLTYTIQKNTRTLEGILQFFQMSKRFVEETTKNKEDAEVKENTAE